MVSRNFNTAELLQVRSEPLRVQQHEFASTQMFHQRHECNLGAIGHAMKHRFPKKCAPHRDAVKAAGESAFVPGFNGMRMTQLMQSRVALDNFMIDPRIFPFRACLDHLRKRAVDTCFKNPLSQHTPQRVGHMKIFQWQDGAGIGRKPFDRVILHGHGKNTESIALHQKFRRNHGALDS